jgi:hypothetical protein
MASTESNRSTNKRGGGDMPNRFISGTSEVEWR